MDTERRGPKVAHVKYEPDFREGQLQQTANTALYLHVLSTTGQHRFPIIITPWEEARWGWDTGYYFPWLGPPHPEQKGCNLFLQYKISTMHVSRDADGGKFWRGEFFRFALGYQRGKRTWDCSQRDALAVLASQGYTVAYVTNHVLDFRELCELASQYQLCSSLPVLQVDDNVRGHVYASFTAQSDHFVLHSESAPAKRLTLKTIIAALPEGRSLIEDATAILSFLRDVEHRLTKEGGIEQELRQVPSEFPGDWAKIRLAGLYLRRYLDLTWIRLPARA